MTDRVHSLTVVLDKDWRVDDVESLTNAIKMMRGVLTVTEHVTDVNTLMARERAGVEVRTRLYDLARELSKR